MSKVWQARTTAPSKTNKYYLNGTAGYNKCINGNANYRPCANSVLSNCVGYAYGRFMEIGGVTSCKLPTCNAEDWYSSCTAYSKSKTPQLGDVAVWGCGKEWNGSDGCGHVAVVEKINKDSKGNITSIEFSESDWSGPVFKMRTCTWKNNAPYLGSAFTFKGFIHNPNADKNYAYTTGTYKVTGVDSHLNVRKGAGTSYGKKKFSEFTANAQAQIKKLNNGKAVDGLVNGCECTVTEVKGNWGKIPSGWICLDYCKKS